MAARLSLAVVALMLPLELIVVATAIAGRDERRAAELENAVLVSQVLAAVVDGFAGDLQSTALSTSLALGLQAVPLDQATAGEALAAVFGQYRALRTLFLTDLQGRVVASPTGGIGVDTSSRPYISQLRGGAETVWSGGIAGVQSGEITVAYGRVVRGPDGTPRAFLIAAFYPQQLFESLPVEIPSDSRVALFDERGQAMYRSDAGSGPLDASISPAVQRALAGELVPIVGTELLVPGENQFGALVPVPRLGWAISFTRPQAAVEAALATQTLAQAGGIALVILLAAGAMVPVARRLTRPLTALAGTAHAIARGENPTIPAFQGDAEVLQLAAAMRVMSEAVADREAALTDQREWLRVTLASIGDAVVATDAEGRVAFVNAAAAALSGWDEQEALGRPVATVLQLLNEQTREPVDDPIARVLREGLVVGLANHTLLVSRNGSERPIDDSAAPIRDSRGKLVGVVMVFRDVTERRRDETERARLLERERSARAAAERAADRIARLQRVTSALGEAVTPEEVARAIVREGRRAVGAHAMSVFSVSDDGAELELLAVEGLPDERAGPSRRPLIGGTATGDAARTGRVITLESFEDWDRRYPAIAPSVRRHGLQSLFVAPLRLERRTLGVLDLSFVEARGFDAEDHAFLLSLGRLCAQALDRARLYEAEQRARLAAQQASAARDVFLSVAAHELKTPIAGLRGFAQLLQRRLQRGEQIEGERAASALRAIDQQSFKLARLVDQLLDVSRVEAGHLSLEPTEVDLAALVRETAERVAVSAADRTVSVSAPPTLAGVADPLRLEQVLANLLDNAVKYSPDGAPVRVELAAEAGLVRLTVEDHGGGIPPEARSRVFERFYRAGSEDHAGGLWLGLYIAREIVTLHGGEITVEAPPAGGSRFVVTLPLSGPTPSPQEEPVSAHPAIPRSN